jgi:Fe-S-cluster-containing hydrogenase component 2
MKMAEEQGKSKGVSRREVIVGGGAALAGVIAGVVAGKLTPGPTGSQGPAGPAGPQGPVVALSKVAEVLATTKLPESQGYLVYDPELCTGCHTCEFICSSVKNSGKVQLSLARITVIDDPFWGKIHDFEPRVCYQCQDPKCFNACLYGAISADPTTGARIVNETKCIGCGLCVTACASYYTPARVALDQTKKKAYKCDLCGGDPQCVKWCSNGALKYSTLANIRQMGYEQNFSEPYTKNFGPPPPTDYLKGGEATFEKSYPYLTK